MLLLWIALFTTWHAEAEKSMGKAISDAMSSMAAMPEIRDSEPSLVLDEF
jgi:hypothetical protein